jgi:small subunit ribosomal protein S2
MQSIEKMLSDGSFDNITKKERLTLSRDRDKMDKVLGGIAQLGRVPAALFIVDIGHEHIALAEAKRLNITTFGLVDTNSDPNKVDFAIPANDDATKSIAILANYLTAAIAEGLAERQAAKDDDTDETVDDDKEKSAARLEAEAQAEAGRGRGGRGRGGNAGGGLARVVLEVRVDKDVVPVVAEPVVAGPWWRKEISVVWSFWFIVFCYEPNCITTIIACCVALFNVQ